MTRAPSCIGIAALMLAGGAGAADFQYGIEAGVGTSDNILRVPANEDSETILTTGLDLRLLREGSLVNADVNVDLTYYDYQDNTFDSEVTGTAEALVNLAFVPERFSWVVQNSFGQNERDPFAAPTPQNRENINYFSTGPDFSVRLGGAGVLTLYGRYSMTDYEDTPLDDDRALGGISLGRDLSARSNVSLNLTTERVEFDDPAFGSDYDRHSAYLSYRNTGARTRIGVQAGMTELHDLGRTNSSPLLDVDIERDVSPRSILALRGGIRSSDASTALRSGNAVGGGGFTGLPGQISTGDPFENRHATLEWRFAAQRTGAGFSAGYNEDKYENQTALDRKREDYDADLYRDVSPHIRLSLRAAYQSSDYDNASFSEDERLFGASLSWNVSGRLYVDLSYDDIHHDSSNPLQDFDEGRAFLRIAWRNTRGGPGSR